MIYEAQYYNFLIGKWVVFNIQNSMKKVNKVIDVLHRKGYAMTRVLLVMR